MNRRGPNRYKFYPENKTIPGHFEKIRGWIVDQIGQSAITWLLGVLGSLVIAGLVGFRERILQIPPDLYLYGAVIIVSATLFFVLAEFKGRSGQTLNLPAGAAVQ